ncbi:MAG: tetratricopeptide repeat protein, partial [Candidatus Omnitrophica bacterium]|nr:tetratricopeptide repeat protein [Candidatus Omnitrophota bacterium]
NTFLSPFHFDDGNYITNNIPIRLMWFKGMWDFFPSRFVTLLTFAVNYHFGGLDVFGYHAVNLAVHLSAALLVWWLVKIIFSSPGMKENELSKFSRIIAFFTAAIFLAHPAQTESVTYIWQRCSCLSGLFYLFSLSFYLKSRVLEAGAIRQTRRRIFYSLAFVSALLGMFTKENIITLPVMLFLCEFYFIGRDKRIGLKRVLPFLLLLPVIPAILLLTKPETFKALQLMAVRPDTAPLHYFFTQLRVLITYIRLLFIPVNQNLDYDYELSKSLASPPVFLSLILLILIIAAAIKMFPRRRLLSFAIIWFFLTLLPESSIIPIDDLIFEHRLYLPVFGYGLFLTCGLCYLFKSKQSKVIIVILSLLVISYSVMAYLRNSVWRSELTLWSDVVRKTAHKARPYINLGIIYGSKAEYDKAIFDFNKAIEIDPGSALAYYNRAVAYNAKGKYINAWEDVHKAESLGHKIPRDFLEKLKKASGREK